ncbi:MAG: beta-propeller fold lactonase family protein [Ancrocorticia sp.]
MMNEIGGTISAFRVNDDGVLSAVPGSDVACGRFPHVPAITPDSKYLYTPGLGGSGIHCYEILGDGSLRTIGTAAFGKDFPEALRISPSGKVLWAFGSKLNLKLSTVLRRYVVQPDGRLVLDPEAVTEVDLTSTSGFPMNIVARG